MVDDGPSYIRGFITKALDQIQDLQSVVSSLRENRAIIETKVVVLEDRLSDLRKTVDEIDKKVGKVDRLLGSDVKPAVDMIQSERQDRRRRIQDLIWKAIAVFVIAVIGTILSGWARDKGLL